MRRTSGSVVCPSCERLVGVNERVCPYCGHAFPGMFGYGPGLRRWLARFDLTYAVIAACGVLYVVALLLDPSALMRFRGIFDLFAPGSGALDALGMTGAYALSQGRWWTVFTAVFLHGSVLHILFNMVILRQFLPNVVELYGAVRSWIIFLVAGAVGFAVSDFAAGAPTIGASGSIFGLLAALIVYGRRTGQGHVTQQLWMSAAVMFVYGFFMPSVNNWAHAGGFAAGFVAAEAMAFAPRREGPGVLVVAGALTLATLAGFALEIARLVRMLLA